MYKLSVKKVKPLKLKVNMPIPTKEVNLQEKSVIPIKDTLVVEPDFDYKGLSKVIVKPIPAEYIIPVGTKEITQNGIYDITAFKKVSINVELDLEEKTITQNGIYTPTTSNGYSKVTVNVEHIPVTNDLDVTQNGVYEAPSNIDGYKKVTVDVNPSLEEITITQNGEYTPSSYGFSKVSVDVPSADLHDYFNYEPSSVGQYFVRDSFYLKSADLIVPSGTTDLSYLCANLVVGQVTPKVICESSVTNVRDMYYNNKTSSIDITGLDLSNTTNMTEFCKNCSNITELDFSTLDLRKVTTLSNLCAGCTNLKKLDLSNNSLEKLGTTGFSNFVQDCRYLEEVKLPVNIGNASQFYVSFSGCNSLTKMVLPFNKVLSYGTSAMSNCYHYTGTVNATYNPEGLKDGYIYVPDNLVNEYKTKTGWKDFATQIKGLSELPEE